MILPQITIPSIYHTPLYLLCSLAMSHTPLKLDIWILYRLWFFHIKWSHISVVWRGLFVWLSLFTSGSSHMHVWWSLDLNQATHIRGEKIKQMTSICVCIVSKNPWYVQKYVAWHNGCHSWGRGVIYCVKQYRLCKEETVLTDEDIWWLSQDKVFLLLALFDIIITLLWHIDVGCVLAA